MQTLSDKPIDYTLTPDFASIATSGNVDLAHDYVRKALAGQILTDIDLYASTAYDDGHRRHLGASLIGAECSRQTWYSFRWMLAPKTSGRQYRLFRRGHLEEARYEEYLRAIGCDFWPVDPNTGKQFRVNGVRGHFGGSLDGLARLPARYGIPGTVIVLTEFKTKGTGRGFSELCTKGVMLTNPQHYDQMCSYGAEYNADYALYMSTCKNNDEMHVEIVPLNRKRAEDIKAKAAFIIDSQEAPPRVAENPTYYKCKYCDYKGICHDNHVPDKNCRSCKFARPVDNGDWYCDGWKSVIPPATIVRGCEQWAMMR